MPKEETGQEDSRQKGGSVRCTARIAAIPA